MNKSNLKTLCLVDSIVAACFLNENSLHLFQVEETLKMSKIENKFSVHYDAVEQQLKVELLLTFLKWYIKDFKDKTW